MTAPPYTESEVRVRLGGPAGFGIKAAGQTLARSFARAGLHTFDLTEYPSLIKGGHNTYHLRASQHEVFSHVEATDILVALDRQTIDRHLAELTDGAALIYDSGEIEVPDDLLTGVCAVPLPLADLVTEAGGQKIMRNTAALGAVLGHMAFPLDYLIESLRAQFGHKAPEIAEQNISVARAGWEHARHNPCEFPHSLEPASGAPGRLLLDGNEAIGLGALAAGIGFYAAYPMTPASSLLHFMAANAEDHSVVVKHTEDEIAAMNMVVGAAFGGARAMCATSGGGFSLMVEAFGLAGISESAVVVGVFTRPGPATGMPTWTEQSDLRFVIHAAQGEFPRVVLAPGDAGEAFDLAWQAFNIADVLQTPVVILGDSYLSDNRRSLASLDVSGAKIDRGHLQAEGEITDYQRYAVTESGISPRALPGVRGAQQIVNSYEHDERGWGVPGEIAATRVAQNEKRMRKLDSAREIVPPPVIWGPEDADVSFVLFGSTKQPVREALQWLERDGITANALQIVTVWPFPSEDVRAFVDRARISVSAEGNYTGQLDGLIRQHCGVSTDHSLRRYDGRPISPEQVYTFAEEVTGSA